MDFLKGLNPPQREAVAYTEGALLILAGAGSGKTRVITHRVAHLISAQHVPPSAVLAVTFTNKAANEMRARVLSLLEGVELNSRPNISTFHSFCVRVLRRDGEPLAQLRPGFRPDFTIYDDDDQLALMRSLYRRLGLDDKTIPHRTMLSRISFAKSHKTSPEELMRNARDPRAQRVAVLYDQYEQELRRANALDFDDLLLEAVRLLAHDETTLQRYNRRIAYLMVDEYQDTNRSQYELMRLLAREHGNACVVGDEDQSIYSWRGADIRNILDFEKDFPDARVIRLEQNYRSTASILDAAGAVVANNTQRKGKQLWTAAGGGEPVTVYSAFDGENEALFIADTIERLLAQNSGSRAAVLYRTNSQSRPIEEALRRYGRKYAVVGGFSFYQRSEVKDLMAYLKLSVSTRDSIALVRVINTPARGIGKTTVEQLDQHARASGLGLWDALCELIDKGEFGARAQAALSGFRKLIEELGEAARSQPVDKVVRLIIERSGYREMLEREDTPDSRGRLENLEEVANAAADAAERGETIGDFLDHAALVSDADSVDDRAQVSLLTVHNAKGLEFPIVFLAGMEENLFPHSRSIASPEAIEEERRLCYVGMTRAEKRLYLSWARYRRRYGGGEQERTVASRFLKEIPRELVEDVDANTAAGQVDLTVERWEVRQSVKRNTYTGKTVNSLENIQQFFGERGVPFALPGKGQGTVLAKPAASPTAAAPPRAPVAPPKAPAPAKRKFGPGSTVVHPLYGSGIVLRREGDGEDAKITVSFPKHGMKKLVEKYAGLKKS